MLALEFVTDSLRDIGVIGETDTPSADQGSTAVRKLNEIMSSLREDGIDLGYAPIASTTDTVLVPIGDVATIKALLSIACAPIYGAAIPPQVALTADRGSRRLLNFAVSLQIERAQSDTLPYGQNQYGRSRILTG